MDESLLYAGFWKRLEAGLIDWILLGVVGLIFFLPFLGVILTGVGVSASEYDYYGHSHDDVSVGFAVATGVAWFFGFLGITIVSWLYYALMESSSKRATLGKMAIGIEVTDMDGGRISFGRATGRFFAKYISGAILYIGYLMAAFTQQKQALHDILAGCLVVNKQTQRSQEG
jgi:uncharacterized RDD family membrane protein YckC